MSQETVNTKTGELVNSRFSPYREWYQFNKDHTASMLWLAKTDPNAMQILFFLLDQMDNLNAVVCSHKVMEEALNMSRRTITRAVKLLKEHNFVQVLKSGATNAYTVNKRIAWSSWGTNYKYCKFEANVLIAQSEQDTEFDAEITVPQLDIVRYHSQKVLKTNGSASTD